MSATEYLRVSDLHAFYGESHVLHGMDFTVRRGECISLLGRNGAGRTTTLRAILGLTGRRTGSIMLNGREVIDMSTHRIAQLGVGYCPEERGIYSSLSCEENLLLPPQVGSGGLSLDEIYEMFPNLKERRHSQGRWVSAAAVSGIGAAQEATWPGAMSPPVAKLASAATLPRCSNTVTSAPDSASSWAVATPTMPAPMTATRISGPPSQRLRRQVAC